MPGYSLWNPWLALGTKVESRGIICLSQASLALFAKFCLDNVPVWADWQASTVISTTVGPIHYEIRTGLALLLMLAMAILRRHTLPNQRMAFLYTSPDNRHPCMKNRQ